MSYQDSMERSRPDVYALSLSNLEKIKADSDKKMKRGSMRRFIHGNDDKAKVNEYRIAFDQTQTLFMVGWLHPIPSTSVAHTLSAARNEFTDKSC